MLKVFHALLACAVVATAAEVGNSPGKPKDDKTPKDVSPGDPPDVAMKKMMVATGLKVDLWAAEPSLQNAVSFSFDEQGRCFVVESYRRRSSVFDIRGFRDWTVSDLSMRTVEDRIAFLKANVSGTNEFFMNALAAAKRGNFDDFNADGRIDWQDLEVESERIQLLADLDGDFKADQSVTYATGFNTLVSGVAAGVLARNGEVWFTCIPDLWKISSDALRSTKAIPDYALPARPGRTGTEFDVKRLHGGFGVHIAYGGHDMHGLKLGPDGKLYWTIADRGFSPPADIRGVGFANAFLRRVLPDTGAVFRSNPDGSNLEVVCVGLRNPQEIAFDEFGNLFTVDNNADGGDKARVHYIVQGADYGWRYGWQHLPKLGAWNDEMLWGLAGDNTSLHQLHPLAHVTHGPAGLAYYPGTGLPDAYLGQFFVADFPGGVRHFKATPDGAGFRIENPGDYLMDNKPANRDGKLLWNLYPTDVDFPPGGGLYVLDWVYGWEKTGKGRIYRVHDPLLATNALIAETKRLLGAGMKQWSLDGLLKLFSHADQRVRLEAQWEAAGRAVRALAGRDVTSANALVAHATGKFPTTGRVHALWALQDCVAFDPALVKPLLPLLNDADAEVRAQAAHALGQAPRSPELERALIAALADAAPRVQFHAALALARWKSTAAVTGLAALLGANADKDAHLRHAAVVALTEIGDRDALLTLAGDGNASVRLGALLAMRRLEMPEVASLLHDTDPRIAREAARAVYDAPIPDALSPLAALLPETTGNGDPILLRRALHANARLGQIEHAQSLLAFAGLDGAPEKLRIEALQAVGDWAEPPPVDRVVGLFRPVPGTREARSAALPLRLGMDALLTGSPPAVQVAAIEALERLKVSEALEKLRALVADEQRHEDVRVAALRAVSSLRDPGLDKLLEAARAAKSEKLRTEANRLLGNVDAATAVASLVGVMGRGSIAEQQGALQTLAGIKGKEADTAIRNALTSLIEGRLRPELALDVLEAAARRASPSIKEKLAAYQAAWKPDDTLAGYRELLTGGNAASGRQIFYERAEAGCFRCHKVAGEGGEVGPELAGMVQAKGREYVLESILYPNKHIATGYETLNVIMKAGQSYAGMKKGETDTALLINSPEDGELNLPKKEIERQSTGMSAMPEGLGGMLNKKELRDLVEFLATVPAKGN